MNEFARPVRRETTVDPLGIYRTIGCHLYGEGVYERETKTGAEIKASRMFLIEKDDLVINRIWAQKGSAGIVPDGLVGAVVTQDFPVWVLNPEKAFPRYIGWYLKTSDFWAECRRHSHGTSGRERLGPKELPSVRVPLPPLDEQRRIVARIEELAALIEEAQELRVKAREEAEALINAQAKKMLSAVGAPVTELRDWLDLNQNGIQTGPFGSNLSANDFVEAGVPVLTIGDVQYDGLHLDDLKYVSEEKAKQLERYWVEAGDILFARMGTVGRCCVVPEEATGWLINYHIIRVALDKSQVEPRFIHWTIQASTDISDYLDENIRGATRKGVNSKIVGSLPCRVPSLTEQRCIVAYLDNLQSQVDELTTAQDATQAELEALLPSVLDQAFRGEL